MVLAVTPHPGAALIKTRSWTKYFQNAPETAKFGSRRAILTDPQYFFFTRDLGYSDFLDASLSRTTVFFKKYDCMCRPEVNCRCE